MTRWRSGRPPPAELRDDPAGLVRTGKREIDARHASRLLP
jgi:hypothetical protein